MDPPETETIATLTEAGTGVEEAPARTDGQAAPSLEDTSLYFNRELSWLDFNDRVLQLAEDTAVPLL